MAEGTELDIQIQKHIIDILEEHKGHSSRIRRGDLLRQVNFKLSVYFQTDLFALSDRKMRNFIEALRTETSAGAWICSSHDGGYYLASSLSELDDYLSIERGRANTLVNRISNQSKHARESKKGRQNSFL